MASTPRERRADRHCTNRVGPRAEQSAADPHPDRRRRESLPWRRSWGRWSRGPAASPSRPRSSREASTCPGGWTSPAATSWAPGGELQRNPRCARALRGGPASPGGRRESRAAHPDHLVARERAKTLAEADRLPAEDRPASEQTCSPSSTTWGHGWQTWWRLARPLAGRGQAGRGPWRRPVTALAAAAAMSYQVELGPTVVVGPADRIGRAVSNLIDNARRWSHQEGRDRGETRRRRASQTAAWLLRAGSPVRLRSLLPRRAGPGTAGLRGSVWRSSARRASPAAGGTRRTPRAAEHPEVGCGPAPALRRRGGAYVRRSA